MFTMLPTRFGTRRGSKRFSRTTVRQRRNQRHRLLAAERLEDRTLLAGQVFPDDPLFSSQWPLHNTGQTGGLYDADIDMPAAWSIAAGNTATVVAVLDTGVDYTHEDLYLNIWLNQGEIPAAIAGSLSDVNADGLITYRDLNEAANASYVSDLNANGYIDAGDLLADSSWADGVDTDGNGYVDDISGYDFADEGNDPRDYNGHGTVVAGIIGAASDNAIGISGICWDIQIMPVKFHNADGTSTLDDAADATNYAVANGATVSNHSWGAPNWGAPWGYSEAVRTAINDAAAVGHIVVAAAGNAGEDNDNPDDAVYPASYDLDNIIAVASSLDDDELWDHSNYGATTVDLAAPSGGISTALSSGRCSDPSGYLDITQFAGGGFTSWAAPHVTGVVALGRSQHPDWTYAQIIDRVLSTVDPLPSLAGKTVSGGRLNAAAALGATHVDTRLFSDSFEHGQWNGLWVQDSQNDWFTSTQRATNGSYSAEVDGSASDATLTIASPIDLTRYGSAELTFDWLIESGLDTGEYLALDLFDGASWQEVAKLRGNVDAENVWHSPVLTIDGSYLVTNFQFQCRAKTSGSDEDANVDNVRLVATSLAVPPPPGISVTPTSGLVTSEDGGSDTFTVVLESAPTASVTVPISSGNPLEGTVDKPSLTFTTSNWSSPQTVTVTGVDDSQADGDVAYTIVVGPATSGDEGYNGLDADDVAAVNRDNEYARAMSETTVNGTVTSGSLAATQASDNVYEAIQEVQTGSGSKRKSVLEHRWTFSVTAGQSGLDTIYVDDMFIVSVGGGAGGSSQSMAALAGGSSALLAAKGSSVVAAPIQSPTNASRVQAVDQVFAAGDAAYNSNDSHADDPLFGSAATAHSEGSSADTAPENLETSLLDEQLVEDLAISLL